MLRICIRLFKQTLTFYLWMLVILLIVGYVAFHVQIQEEHFIQILETGNENQTDHLACVHPKLDFGDPSKRQEAGVLKCGPQDWVYINNGSLFIKPNVLEEYENVQCSYSPVQRVRGDDFHVTTHQIFYNFTNGKQIDTDFFHILCTGISKEDQNEVWHENIHSSISYKQAVNDRKENKELIKNSLGLNILMFGFDSVSQVVWRTHLTETYKYFIETLKGVVLEGYNIVGDGTPQALLPILTGKTEVELPEARKAFLGAKKVDDHPWIWKNLTNLGYVTQYGEDGAGAGTFQYRMLGFKEQPTDYYLRPLYLAKNASKHQRHCFGETPRHLNMLNWIKDLYHMYPYKRKFSFLFHSEYTHSEKNYRVQFADHDLKQFLEYMETSGHLNNTLLILMADHGPRYTLNRKSVQGKYEERLPYFSLRLPPWFQRVHPEAVRNLKVNSLRLTTPFDIHETLLDVVNFSEAGLGNVKQRGISLFKEIPVERTCENAAIAPHWCSCMNWTVIRTQSPQVNKAAIALVDKINSFTNEHRDICSILTVSSINSAVMFAPNIKILKFKQSQDTHGRIADLSDNMKASEILYQLTISVKPSGGQYEATIKHVIKNDQYKVDDKEISRINKYGNQPHCIMSQKPHLRPYCYCRPIK